MKELMGHSPEVTELLEAMGIHIRDQLVRAVAIDISVDGPVKVTVERFLKVPDMERPVKILKRYCLVEDD